MAENKLADMSTEFAIQILKLTENINWIEIAQKAGLISEEVSKTVLHDCGIIRRMLISSINTAKENMK